jgi:4-carboxymuconolactone decarboxylase
MSNTPSPIEQAREARPDDAAFQAGLTTRAQVMGPEYVDRALGAATDFTMPCLLYTSPSPRDA